MSCLETASLISSNFFVNFCYVVLPTFVWIEETEEVLILCKNIDTIWQTGPGRKASCSVQTSTFCPCERGSSSRVLTVIELSANETHIIHHLICKGGSTQRRKLLFRVNVPCQKPITHESFSLSVRHHTKNHERLQPHPKKSRIHN